MQREVPKDITTRLKKWLFWRNAWSTIHYFLGGTGILASISTAAKPPFVGVALMDFLPWWSTVCIALLAFLRADAQARGFWVAWRTLEQKIGQFNVDPNISAAELYKAIDEGEQSLSQTRPFSF